MRKSAINDLEVNVTLFKWHIKLRFGIHKLKLKISEEEKEKRSFMEDENWELNEKNKEFGKWIFGSLVRYFLYLFMNYFLFIDYIQVILEVCRGHFQKTFGLKLSSRL